MMMGDRKDWLNGKGEEERFVKLMLKLLCDDALLLTAGGVTKPTPLDTGRSWTLGESYKHKPRLSVLNCWRERVVRRLLGATESVCKDFRKTSNPPPSQKSHETLGTFRKMSVVHWLVGMGRERRGKVH